MILYQSKSIVRSRRREGSNRGGWAEPEICIFADLHSESPEIFHHAAAALLCDGRFINTQVDAAANSSSGGFGQPGGWVSE